MRRSIAVMLAVAFVSSLCLAAGLYAQATKDEKTGLDRLEGTVLSVHKETSEIKIRQKAATNVDWTIEYTPETKYTYRNEKGSIDQVKEGVRVICLGTFDSKDQTKLKADRIDVRTQK